MSKPLTTQDAFEMVITKKSIHKELGTTADYVRSLRYSLKNGRGISINKMEEILTLAGYTIAQEKLWKK